MTILCIELTRNLGLAGNPEVVSLESNYSVVLMGAITFRVDYHTSEAL
jgi:hypothetical protein